MNVADHMAPLSEIIARFPGHLFWKNKAGIYMGCNLEQALSFGLNSIDDVIGKTNFDLLRFEDALRLKEIDQYIIGTGQAYNIEEPVMLQGEERIYISKKSPLRDLNGHIIGVIGTAIDITEQKRTEVALRDAMQKAQQANLAKNEFIANMSHDLRTPLSGMQALAENMRLATDDPELIYDTELLLSASRDLLQLVDSILDVVRMDANQKSPDREFKLRSLVNNSVNIIQPKVKEKQIAFTVYYDDALPPFLLGQPLMLQRILMNILSNALKFTETSGEVQMSVTLDSRTATTCIVIIEIRDTGIGIPQDKLDIIFDKFSRVSASFKGQYEGTGVGLYMVKQYLERMQGTIAVVSSEGMGTTVTCHIPLMISETTAVESVSSRMVSEQKRYTHVTILLVEDSPIAQQSHSTKLKSLGCRVQIAGTAEQAIELFKNQKFDLLMIDLGLPDLDGWSLTQRFRAERINPNSEVPIVILTAHAEEDVVMAEKENMGLIIFKRKPLMLADAEELLANCII